MRSFRSRVDCRIASKTAIDLPCPWAPLQSMTAVATQHRPVRLGSRRVHEAIDGSGGRYCDRRPEGIETIPPGSPGMSVTRTGKPGAAQGVVTRPPMGFGSFRRTQYRWSLCVPAYHPDTIRSQSFSPSQRFDPTWTSWLCFTPHPPIGFWSSEPFPLRQLQPLARFHALRSLG